MSETLIIKPRLNTYPINIRLLGDKTPGRLQLAAIEGTALRNIVHALTWLGVPIGIDELIAKLPKEEEIMSLNPLSRKYLAFTVYGLQQMIAAGTLSPENAWSLFYREWDGVSKEKVCHEDFIRRRADFFSGIHASSSDKIVPADLLEFEFWARAGAAGLEQFKRYSQWAEKLIFIRKKFKQLGEEIKEEYRKALWLEMRILEGQLGLNRLNKDVGKMILLRDGAYFFEKKRAIGCGISLKSTESMDSTIKAEMGHWMFELLAFRNGWVEELMDRMNMSNYTEAVAEGFKIENPEQRSPMARTFIEGGYFLASWGIEMEDLEAYYPIYPAVFPKERVNTSESHEVAELMERMIRSRLVKAVEGKELPAEKVLRMYRRTGLYVALLSLQGRSRAEIAEKVWDFDRKEINLFAREYEEIARPELRALLKDDSQHMAAMAAKALSHFDRNKRERWGSY